MSPSTSVDIPRSLRQNPIPLWTWPGSLNPWQQHAAEQYCLMVVVRASPSKLAAVAPRHCFGSFDRPSFTASPSQPACCFTTCSAHGHGSLGILGACFACYRALLGRRKDGTRSKSLQMALCLPSSLPFSLPAFHPSTCNRPMVQHPGSPLPASPARPLVASLMHASPACAARCYSPCDEEGVGRRIDRRTTKSRDFQDAHQSHRDDLEQSRAPSRACLQACFCTLLVSSPSAPFSRVLS